MAKRALITGASGQDGYYLIDLLRAQGYAVHAQSRRPGTPDRQRDGVHWHVGDPADAEFLERLILDIVPDEIYNLVAISRPTQSWNVPRETAALNALVPERICKLLVARLPRCRLFQASSSEIFGDSLALCQNELTHCVPKTPYGISKLYAHRIVGAYRQRYGLYACSGIMFNHESPRRPPAYVSQKIAYAAAAIALGMTDSPARDENGRPIVTGGKLYLGDLGVKRDFGFAGDYVEAMHMLLQHSTPDDYVIGTGRSRSIQEFCEIAFRSVGRRWTDHVRIDPQLFRKIDSRYTCADTSKLRNVYGWTPKTAFEELVAQMVSAQTKTLGGGDFVDAV